MPAPSAAFEKQLNGCELSVAQFAPSDHDARTSLVALWHNQLKTTGCLLIATCTPLPADQTYTLLPAREN